MSQDPYSYCPCGSGRKLKFCCGDILNDLLKIHRLEENQPEAAERMLRDLLVKYPLREVLVGELSGLLQHMGQVEESRELLTAFLKKNPDHPRGLVWLARLALAADGFEVSRRLVHRTFQISSRTFPLELAELAHAIGLYLVREHEYMGGREHIALAARLAGPERGRQYLMNLAMLEADSVIPFILRTPQVLLPVSGDDEFMQHDLRARKLSSLGCWEPAAIIYSRMTETHPDNGAVWYNLGLCRAWDGRSAAAAAALHQAATLISDFDTAVDAEALAQILDQRLPERQYQLQKYQLPVRSCSQLLTLLDQMPTALRYDDEELEDEDSRSTWPPGMERVAMYDLLDRPQAEGSITDAAQLSEAIADLELLDIVDETAASAADLHSPLLWVTVVDDHAEQVLQQLRSVCGDQLLPAPEALPQPVVVVRQPRDARDFDCRQSTPDGMSRSRFRELTAGWNDRLADRWTQRNVLALGGRTPLEAAADPSLKVQLAAAVLALTVNARYFERTFDVTALRQKLGVPEPAATQLPAGQHCAAFPAFFVQRLDCARLDDTQLQEFVNRVSMLGFAELARRGLDELLQRASALEQFGVVRACLMRAAIARSDNDRATLSACTQKAREAAAKGKESFRELLEIEIRELAMRLDDPTDPELIELLHRIRDRYFGKLPEIGEVIQAQLQASGCEHLLSELESPVALGSSAGGTLWTPQSSGEPAGAGGGLWLPGQD